MKIDINNMNIKDLDDDYLRLLVLKSGISQKEIADIGNTARQNVYNFMHHRTRKTSQDVIIAVLDAIGYDVIIKKKES